MADLEQQLRDLRPGKPRRIRGISVRREGDSYLIEGDQYTIEDAVRRINQEGSQKSGIDYTWTVFLEKTPSGSLIKWYRCADKSVHTSLVEAVKGRSNYLWYAQVIKRDDGTYYASSPHLLDWDSVPEHPHQLKTTPRAELPPPDPSQWKGGLTCPFCRKVVSSTPGRTLHVKQTHPEKLQEYLALLQKTLVAAKAEPDDEDVVNHLNEGELLCPYCGQKMTSTPGRTLHVKAKHPERLDEYKKQYIK